MISSCCCCWPYTPSQLLPSPCTRPRYAPVCKQTTVYPSGRKHYPASLPPRVPWSHCWDALGGLDTGIGGGKHVFDQSERGRVHVYMCYTKQPCLGIVLHQWYRPIPGRGGIELFPKGISVLNSVQIFQGCVEGLKPNISIPVDLT